MQNTPKDWTGGKNSLFVCNGADRHDQIKRAEFDYYATDPLAAGHLLRLEPHLTKIWEPACGQGHLARVFDKAGKLAQASDIVDRGYHSHTCGPKYDFLHADLEVYGGDIITNPPYKFAKEFVFRALQMVLPERYVCMFLKLTFLEGIGRKELFETYPPLRIWVSRKRIKCAPNGDFGVYASSAVAYAWYVWQKGWKGPTTINWFN